MIICVYGAASNNIDQSFFEKCEELGYKLGINGHSLVYGAGGCGLMGATARGFKKAGAHVHGVIPKFFEENGYEAIFNDADKITRTDTMEERKAIMENECSAFIVTPGGVGTLDELFQIITLKQLGRMDKPIAIYNVNGYYNKTIELIEEAIEKGFINKECEKLFAVFTDLDEMVEYIENYSGTDIKWDFLKK